MNTYGFGSINNSTLNTSYSSDHYYPKPIRDIVVTGLRVHNLTLDILGYTFMAPISGSVRLMTGSLMLGATLLLGDKNASKGLIIGKWYDEMLNTAKAQIFRATLEILGAKGINAAIGAVCTVTNLAGQIDFTPADDYDDIDRTLSKFIKQRTENPEGPHPEPKYPALFEILNLA